MVGPRITIALILVASSGMAPQVAAGDPLLAQEFSSGIRPLLKQYCLECHSTEKQKGELDLERFSSFENVLKHPKVWEAVIEQLTLGEMPPKEKSQPAVQERERLMSWVNRALNEAAQANAG